MMPRDARAEAVAYGHIPFALSYRAWPPQQFLAPFPDARYHQRHHRTAASPPASATPLLAAQLYSSRRRFSRGSCY